MFTYNTGTNDEKKSINVTITQEIVDNPKSSIINYMRRRIRTKCVNCLCKSVCKYGRSSALRHLDEYMQNKIYFIIDERRVSVRSC